MKSFKLCIGKEDSAQVKKFGKSDTQNLKRLNGKDRRGQYFGERRLLLRGVRKKFSSTLLGSSG